MKIFVWFFVLFLSADFCYAQTDTLQTASGLRYVILKTGTGPKITKGSKIKVHYTGRFRNGKIFDTSEGKSPLKIKAGTGEVIAGWDEMLLLMQAGEEVEVLIPAALAYGNYGIPDPEAENNGYRIPPDTDLIFRMKVVELKR